MSLSALAGLVLALALAVALLAALHFRLGGLPHAFVALARKERAQDGLSLLDAMKEAVATRSGQAVIAVQAYHEQLAHSLRGQVADAETRARAAERRAADTVTALEAASTLLRELRAALDATSEITRDLRTALNQKRSESPRPPPPRPPPRPASMAEIPAPTPPPSRTQPPSGPPPAEPEVEAAERTTTELPGEPPRPAVKKAVDAATTGGPQPRPPASGPPAASLPVVDGKEPGFDDEDEMTRVANRPGPLAAFRLARRAPTLLPPAPILTGAPRTSGSGGPR